MQKQKKYCINSNVCAGCAPKYDTPTRIVAIVFVVFALAHWTNGFYAQLYQCARKTIAKIRASYFQLANIYRIFELLKLYTDFFSNAITIYAVHWMILLFRQLLTCYEHATLWFLSIYNDNIIWDVFHTLSFTQQHYTLYNNTYWDWHLNWLAKKTPCIWIYLWFYRLSMWWRSS